MLKLLCRFDIFVFFINIKTKCTLCKAEDMLKEAFFLVDGINKAIYVYLMNRSLFAQVKMVGLSKT